MDLTDFSSLTQQELVPDWIRVRGEGEVTYGLQVSDLSKLSGWGLALNIHQGVCVTLGGCVLPHPQ